MKLSAALSFEGQPQEIILRAVAEAGFDGCGLNWKQSYTDEEWFWFAAKLRQELGLLLTYVHAPWSKISSLWRNCEEAELVFARLVRCMHAAAEVEAPILVLHSYIGFQNCDPVSQIGIDRFGNLVRQAEKLGIQIAFENTEGEPYLAALMGAFAKDRHVGFCWDSGHEVCYNGGKDQLALYGDRLLCTHLNDNMGCHGPVSPINDLHLLPFDGRISWEDIAARLDEAKYGGSMHFELSANSKPGRHENDCYQTMGLQAYAKLAYERACRVAAWRKG